MVHVAMPYRKTHTLAVAETKCLLEPHVPSPNGTETLQCIMNEIVSLAGFLTALGSLRSQPQPTKKKDLHCRSLFSSKFHIQNHSLLLMLHCLVVLEGVLRRLAFCACHIQSAIFSKRNADWMFLLQIPDQHQKDWISNRSSFERLENNKKLRQLETCAWSLFNAQLRLRHPAVGVSTYQMVGYRPQ